MKKQNKRQLRQRGLDLMNAWRADWCRFAREALGVTLDAEQQEILRSVQFNRRTSVASGTARGKDFVAAVAAVCFLYLTPRWRKNEFGKVELCENTKVALTCPDCRHKMQFLELYYNHQRVSLEEMYENAMSKSRGKRSSA